MRIRHLLGLAIVLLGSSQRGHHLMAAAPSSILPIEPLIESIDLDGTNAVVLALVSGGARTVTLESRARASGGAWEPRAVQRLEPGSAPARTVVFKITVSSAMELLRVRQDDSERLPESFYKGTNSFGLPGASGIGPGGGIFNRNPVAAGPGQADDAAAPPADRDVVESDIWKLDGDTLYFFNQFRGLQVIDLSQPDSPVVRGSYSLPAAGEQMYLMQGNRVILLVGDSCNASGVSQSHLHLLNIDNGRPNLVHEVPLSGNIRESRLVGTALYVVSELYREVDVVIDPSKNDGPNGGGSPNGFTKAEPGDGKPAADEPGAGGVPSKTWEWGSEVASFDLSDFSNPVPKSRFWVPGYGNVIQATDKFLFVASPANQSGWGARSDIHLFDIASSTGEMAELSTIKAQGYVKDKFKMNLEGDILRVVTENASENWKTRVETFSLGDPKDPSALGSLVIIEREQLHATRFAGNLLYAVTFFRTDPLWIIDLSDPANPKKVGDLEIPGWSTFIYPWEDRLVTIGIDNEAGWRTAVQLFDVHDPSKPALIGKVTLGEQYSSSEANSDEKAFGVFPDEGLVLVPYSTYQDGKAFEGVHLIDLAKAGLTKRGSINHTFQPRRATLHRDRILSLSGVELLTVDASDRDNPRVVATTELSWGADRVILAGDFLIAIASPWNSGASLRIASTQDSDAALNRVILGDLPLIGATTENQKLYLLQGKSTEVIWPKEWNPTNYFPLATNQARLLFSIFDLSQLPNVNLVSKTEIEFQDHYWGAFEALWPKPNLLVWSSSASGYSGPYPVDVIQAGRGVAVDSARLAWPWWGNSESHLIAFDISDSAAPKLESHVAIRGTNNWWNFSKAFTSGGLVYFSHQTSGFDPGLRGPPSILEVWDGEKYFTRTNPSPAGIWIQRDYLDVVNYADSKDPSVRKPVNIPGTLVGISHNGAVIYTQGYRYTDPAAWAGYEEWLDASAYDGVEAHLVTSLTLNSWPHPLATKDSAIFIGRGPEATPDKKALLEVWTLLDSGKFDRINALPMENTPQSLKLFGNLLAAQFDRVIELIDVRNPAFPVKVGQGAPEGCLYYNLENASGSLEKGLWLPMSFYGMGHIPVRDGN